MIYYIQYKLNTKKQSSNIIIAVRITASTHRMATGWFIYRNLMVKRLQKWIKSEINIRSGNVRSDQLRLSRVKFGSDELDSIKKDKVMPSQVMSSSNC